MTKEEFRQLTNNNIILLDGATGTNLQKKGMPTGVCPEKWILENKEVLMELQSEYVEAGTNIIYAPTFSGNRIKLKEYGLEDKIELINKELVKISKKAANNKAYVAGNLTMTGEQLAPLGNLTFEELIDIYKEQIDYITQEGVDLFVVETMMSLQETRAAVLAIKEKTDLPIMATMTFNEDGRTLYGTDAKTAIVVLQSLGADAVGINCSTGPDKMLTLVKEMKKYAKVPIIVKPNAGLPKLENGQTTYDMDTKTFCDEVEKLIKEGASIIGGCCGTTPEFIKAIKQTIKEKNINKKENKTTIKSAISTDKKTVDIDLNGRFMIIGERINPTGKKALQAELLEGKLDIISKMAIEQSNCGADILDINVGMNGIDEKETMIKVIEKVTKESDTPIAIDSSNIKVIEAALRLYPGRALVNSISLEEEKFNKLLPIAKHYGAMFILLPLSDKGLPENLQEKKDIINTILKKAYELGFKKEDIIVDGLVTTVGANKQAALETLETIKYCKEELKICTSIGLSNISFGLPQRQYINSTFLSFAIKDGLTMAIANPSQDLLVNTALASDLLLAKEGSDLRYINEVKNIEFNTKQETLQKKSSQLEQKPKIYEEVLKGNTDTIIQSVKETLSVGEKPEDIINNMLIPAIDQVGKLFDESRYFLPQLISSANAMEKAIEYLEPMIEKKSDKKEAITIVIATVKGDIHDIGKNLVSLMLRNYGYNVIDLGKDVSAEQIISTAIEHNAQIIGLSALMTTTMQEMKTVISLAKEKNVKASIIIGGAVITESYAEEIGADYSKDAAGAVNLVKKLLSKNI